MAEAASERGAHKLDQLDRQILDVLRAEPRITNKSLAGMLSTNEVTIATRIRAMEQAGVMRVVAQLDFRALDYNLLAIVDVSVIGRKIADVAADLAQIEGVGSVSIMLGDPPIIVQVQARDLAHLRDLILDEISAVVGVAQVETNVIVEIEKWKSQYGRFTPPGMPGWKQEP